MYLVYVCITIAVGFFFFMCVCGCQKCFAAFWDWTLVNLSTRPLSETHMWRTGPMRPWKLWVLGLLFSALVTFCFGFIVFLSSNKIWATNWTRMLYLNFFTSKVVSNQPFWNGLNSDSRRSGALGWYNYLDGWDLNNFSLWTLKLSWIIFISNNLLLPTASAGKISQQLNLSKQNQPSVLISFLLLMKIDQTEKTSKINLFYSPLCLQGGVSCLRSSHNGKHEHRLISKHIFSNCFHKESYLSELFQCN